MIGSSIKDSNGTMKTSENKNELIKHKDALLYYVEWTASAVCLTERCTCILEYIMIHFKS